MLFLASFWRCDPEERSATVETKTICVIRTYKNSITSEESVENQA